MNKITAFIVALVLSFAGVTHAATATFTAQANTATPFANPDRGWALWTGQDLLTNYQPPGVTYAPSGTARLASCLVNLQSYRTTDDISAVVATLNSRLATIRGLGYKCVMWVAYNFSGSYDDAPATRIATHLNQLKPTFRTYADTIAYVKAGFIGGWGEWAFSNQGNSSIGSPSVSYSVAAANRIIVRNALLAAVHPLTAVQFRYPDDIAYWYPTGLTATQAYNGSAQSRVGFHNDCQLAGNNDSYTFQNWGGGVSTASLKTYVAGIGRYVPYGGELANCDQPHRTTCPDVVGPSGDFYTYGLSWLKDSGPISDYINGWTSGGCWNEVNNLMGYRLIYNSVVHQSTATAGQTITATVSLRNVGWSRVQHPRKIQIVMVRSGGGASDVVCNSRVDLRALPAKATTNSNITVNCTTGIAGTWTVHLRMPDIWPNTAGTAAFAIRPANTDGGGASWDATNFRWTTGTTVVVS
jgi:Domain of unknown function (DUF4832)/Domain of unknown function (DUF4874)